MKQCTKLNRARNPKKKAFVSAMQKICWYFWLHYGIQRSDSSPTAQFSRTVHLTAEQQTLSTFCLPRALSDKFLWNWRKITFGILNIVFPKHSCISWIE